MRSISEKLLSRRQFLQAMTVFLCSCATKPVSGVTPTPEIVHFSGEKAMQHAIEQMKYIPRDTGTDGWRKTGDYILAQFKAAGWQAVEQTFPYQNIQCRNLIGKRGTGPILIIGAHYDSRKRADQDPDPYKRTLPVPAANDGASGIAILLELARILKPETLNRTIWLAAFDAEDNGDLDGWDWIQGSTYMANNLPELPQGMILLDMIGDADQQLYYERNSHPAMMEGLWKVAADLGYKAFVPQYRHSMIDDHIPFAQKGIPAVDIIDFDYPAWHTTSDTIDKISVASLEAVGCTLEEWLTRNAPGMPVRPKQLYLPFLPRRFGCQLRAAERIRGKMRSKGFYPLERS